MTILDKKQYPGINNNKKSYGSLTYLIWKELSTLKSKVIDFKAIGEKLLQQKGQTMSKRQKPYLVIEYL